MKTNYFLCCLISIILTATNLFSQDKNKQFWNAASTNDTETVKKLLSEGIEVDVKTEYGATALTFASDKGHVEVVKLLLEKGADPNSKDSFYQTSVFNWALYKGNAEVLVLLINHGADISTPMPMAIASGSGSKEVVKLLIEKGAPGVDQALISVVKNENPEMAALLIIDGKPSTEAMTNALITAYGIENKEIIDLLIKNGAKMPEKKAGGDSGELSDIYNGQFSDESGQKVKIENKMGSLFIYFDGEPYTLIRKEGNTFNFAEFPQITIAFVEVEGQIVSCDLDDGEQVAKFNRIVEMGVQTESETKPINDNDATSKVEKPLNWTSFRGNQASGIADGQFPPIIWSVKENINIKWKTYIPGLAHSCPIVWENKVFVTAALSSDTAAEFRVGLYGDVEPADDMSSHIWKIYCLEKNTGKTIWEKKAYEGIPRVARHTKASQANSTPVTNGQFVVALYGSEGMVCYDMNGNEQWRKDLGKLDAGWFFDTETQWGHSSSPIIYENLVIVQVDRSKDCYIAAYDLKTGNQVWNTPREEISSWGTPTVFYGEKRDELITNATKFIRAYNPKTGEELWRLAPNSELTVATPVVSDSLIYVTAGYPPVFPIYAIRPGGNGDISIPDSVSNGEFVKWSYNRNGTYMPTPIAYNNYFYTLSNYGHLCCYDAKSGDLVYKEKIKGGGAFTASPVAADGKIFCTSEEDGVFVIKAGPEYELITSNQIGEICVSTPAISDRMIFIRAQHHLFCIGRTNK